jgi:hypothetical protein
VGDDACLILWDARTGTSPAVKVIFFSILSRLTYSKQKFAWMYYLFFADSTAYIGAVMGQFGCY